MIFGLTTTTPKTHSTKIYHKKHFLFLGASARDFVKIKFKVPNIKMSTLIPRFAITAQFPILKFLMITNEYAYLVATCSSCSVCMPFHSAMAEPLVLLWHGLIPLATAILEHGKSHGTTSRKAARGRVCSSDEVGHSIDCSYAIFWPWGWTQWLGQHTPAPHSKGQSEDVQPSQ